MNVLHAFRAVVADQVQQVRAVNRRYAEPRLKMSAAVKWSLLSLRLYLLVLVGLLAYKFITIIAR